MYASYYVNIRHSHSLYPAIFLSLTRTEASKYVSNLLHQCLVSVDLPFPDSVLSLTAATTLCARECPTYQLHPKIPLRLLGLLEWSVRFYGAKCGRQGMVIQILQIGSN
ncbi:hypothetical protein CDAR_371851 [Caerostris darwini]|uniref:Uncharacterized protein n=1 Tax=Caerostris darwini TaxID=1538125 RepID=A0AAV4U138_9ARAC|nr:hypothetical protein CDAR_371851 [Caerostris darwini]